MAKKFQSGAVSIFAVVFAALLLTVLTVGFIKIMVDEQQRATNSDLSQSAYDSAIAGVEDAKRVLRLCNSGNSVACSALYDKEKAGDCQVVSRALGNSPTNETIIQSSSGTGQESFDQAYTCVNVVTDTEDYIYTSQEGSSEMIPIRGSGNIRKISIEWYTQQDAGRGVEATTPGGNGLLPGKASGQWGPASPPIVRAQIIRPGASISDINSLDHGAASQTVFIQPDRVLSSGVASNPDITNVGKRSRPADTEQLDNSTSTIMCSKFAVSHYSCKAVLDFGEDRVLSQADSANAFLRLSTIYRGATVRVKMLSESSQVVKFNGVQPAVDSTGRASNLFRRVEARLKIGDDFPYPNYAADIANDICKDFSIYENRAAAGSCRP